MAIQQINLGSAPSGAGGDTQRAANEKINQNFSNTTHAANRLVGTATGNVMEVGAFGLGLKNSEGYKPISLLPKENNIEASKDFIRNIATGLYKTNDLGEAIVLGTSMSAESLSGGSFVFMASSFRTTPPQYAYITSNSGYIASRDNHTFYTTQNVTKDGNGFLKGASPVVDLYDDKIELNRDAEQQGSITFEKLGTGNYLVKGSLGFAQEGWYIEMPKDANANVLVAVVYEQLENNDISIKTYDYMLNKKGRIVPDTETPLDIPTGRCINLRLHEIKEQLDEPIE